MTISSLDHLHVYAADPDHTLSFFQEHFGAERVGTLPNRSGTGNHFLLLGGQLLVVSTFPDGMGPSEPPARGDGALRAGFGIAHFGLQTTDLDGLVARLQEAGVEVHDAPATSGPIRYVYVSAPDGVVIELVELQLPRRLRALRPVLAAYQRLVHGSKRLLVRRLFA